MSLSFTVSSTAADRVAADLLAVAVAKGPELGPGAEAVDAALGGGLTAFLAEAGFEGKLGETLAVPAGGQLKAKAVLLVGVGDPAELTVDGVRAWRRRRPEGRQGDVARDHARRPRAPGSTVADAAQAVAEGLVLGGYQYLDYKGERHAVEAAEGHGHRGRRRARARGGRARGRGRRRGHVGARPR